MRERPARLFFSCEHASNRIPTSYRDVSQRAGTALDTHRGYDPGALELTRLFARKFGTSLFLGKWSRLLIELNRSQHHARLWSEFSQSLPAAAKRSLVEDYYLPYRYSVEHFIHEEATKRRRVIHVSVHSFTPVLDGETRTADIGLLYDPGRSGELKLCRDWAEAIAETQPELRVRKNYPYRGTADGFTTHLRKRFNESVYIGIELEVNQKFPTGPSNQWRQLQRTLVRSLAAALEG